MWEAANRREGRLIPDQKAALIQLASNSAAAIHGSELLLIDGMGHDLPPALFETFADGIRRTASRGC